MRVELVPQLGLGGVQRLRVGDILNQEIGAPATTRFRFAVAYMRLSGWDRLTIALECLLNRGGAVAGAVGIDDEITTVEALESLAAMSPDSTVFHSSSDLIYHPKVYLVSGAESAVAVVGSANLTRDGLFRNVEVATAVYLDFTCSADLAVYRRYDTLLAELLSTTHPNVRPVNPDTIARLTKSGMVKRETAVGGPGHALDHGRQRSRRKREVAGWFPPLAVPPAPPRCPVLPQPTGRPPAVVRPPVTTAVSGIFLMQLSSFDSSHRPGVKGTAEVLIPHEAAAFFPPLKSQGRRYPDAFFEVALNTPSGAERHCYRFWYYEHRATGTKIDEYRLRMDKETVALAARHGGDLLVFTRLPPGSDPAYEATVLPQTDPTFPAFLSLCTKCVYNKRWAVL